MELNLQPFTADAETEIIDFIVTNHTRAIFVSDRPALLHVLKKWHAIIIKLQAYEGGKAAIYGSIVGRYVEHLRDHMDAAKDSKVLEQGGTVPDDADPPEPNIDHNLDDMP